MNRRLTCTALAAAFAGILAVAPAHAQQKEIRVMLANHPYGDLIKANIGEFEKAHGIKVNLESLQESQLTTKLTTEFATNSSTVDVFMTRPLQDGKLFYKNGWYEPITQDLSDIPKNTLSVASYSGKPYMVPLVTEWQVMFYRKDLLSAAGLKVPATFAELESAAQKLNSDAVAGFGSRGKTAAAVTQLSSYIYGYGGSYLDHGKAVFDSKAAVDAIRFYGKLLGSYGPKGVTSMSWENLLPLFQAGKLAIWTDASVFYGNVIDPTKTSLRPEQIGVAPLPAGPKANSPFYVASWAIAISKQSKKKDLAKEFVAWASGKELSAKALAANITVARSSVWDDKAVTGKMEPGLLETRALAAKNGTPTDRPFMSAVGEARDLIGELILESINTKGASTQLDAMAKDRAEKVNELLQDTGEFGK